MRDLTREDIKRMEAELRQAEANLGEMRSNLIDAKIEVGNAEFAAKGINVGDKVKVTQTKFSLVSDANQEKTEIGVFVGYQRARFSIERCEPCIKKIKKDGTASVRDLHLAYNVTIEPVEDDE